MKQASFFLNDRLTDSQIEKFKLFEDEELIFACREHWLPVSLHVLRESIISLLLASAFALIFIFGAQSITFGISIFMFTILVGSIISIRNLIYWSFHMYIATNKQIIEVHYTPLMSQATNSVLLDQIRCTEIDVNMYGIIPGLIGIGDVEITFDRPTHKEQFIIHSIRSPHAIANLLSAQIHQTLPSVAKNQVQQPVWVRELKNNKYRFLGNSNYEFSNS